MPENRGMTKVFGELLHPGSKNGSDGNITVYPLEEIQIIARSSQTCCLHCLLVHTE